MTDTISRQAAIDAVADLYWMDERLLNFKKEIDATFDKIKALPSARPEPRPKHGRWEDVEEVLDEGITDGTPYTVTAVGYKCSECGTEMGYLWSFCPNCGARMERSEYGET